MLVQWRKEKQSSADEDVLILLFAFVISNILFID
jgi:hypothetical protein